MPVRFKTTKIAQRAQSDPLLYEVLRDLGRASDDIYRSLAAAQGYLVPTGGILIWPTAAIPAGFLLCDGAAVKRGTYAALFAVIGVAYGIGDGVSTFNVPDFRQRFPLGTAASGTGATLAGTGGAIDHVHSVDPPSTTTGAPSLTAKVDVGAEDISVPDSTHTHTVDIAAFDSAASNPPFLAVNFVIKT